MTMEGMMMIRKEWWPIEWIVDVTWRHIETFIYSFLYFQKYVYFRIFQFRHDAIIQTSYVNVTIFMEYLNCLRSKSQFSIKMLFCLTFFLYYNSWKTNCLATKLKWHRNQLNNNSRCHCNAINNVPFFVSKSVGTVSHSLCTMSQIIRHYSN